MLCGEAKIKIDKRKKTIV